MPDPLMILDERLSGLSRMALLSLALVCVLVIGGIDYVTGYEISMSLLYLLPVGLAAWYSGRGPVALLAVSSAGIWYLADLGAGHPYSSAAIPVWNSFIRFGFFLIGGILLIELRKSLHTQRQLSRLDALTGLYTRREFEERLAHDLALARRHGRPLTLAFVDLDNFKQVNDTHGHAEGDRLLILIGHALKDAVRRADTPVRLGGDEFALILPDTDEHGARQVIAGVERSLVETFHARHQGVGCSIGVVTVRDPAVAPEALVAAADALMYEVKRAGKGAADYRVL